jgi:hypothetical protein
MYFIEAKVKSISGIGREYDSYGTYFYGPYATKDEAQAIINQADDRKGDKAPEMTIRFLQLSDSFLVGSAARTYQVNPMGGYEKISAR